MPSSATITAFYSFSANTKARAAQVNANFDVFRGHIIPVEPNTATAHTSRSYDLGDVSHFWNKVYNVETHFYNGNTTTHMKLYKNSTNMDLSDGTTVWGRWNVNGYNGAYMQTMSVARTAFPTRKYAVPNTFANKQDVYYFSTEYSVGTVTTSTTTTTNGLIAGTTMGIYLHDNGYSEAFEVGVQPAGSANTGAGAFFRTITTGIAYIKANYFIYFNTTTNVILNQQFMMNPFGGFAASTLFYHFGGFSKITGYQTTGLNYIFAGYYHEALLTGAGNASAYSGMYAMQLYVKPL